MTLNPFKSAKLGLLAPGPSNKNGLLKEIHFKKSFIESLLFDLIT